MIRDMMLEDVSHSLQLFEAHYKAIGDEVPFIPGDAANFVSSLINNPRSITLIKVEDEKPVGIISFITINYIYNSTQRYAAEVLWYAYEPKVMISLWDAAMPRLEAAGLRRIQIGIPSTGKIQKWLTRRGFKPIRIGFERSE